MAMDHVEALECTVCGETYDPDAPIYTCPNHDGVTGILEVVYDYDLIDERFDADLDGHIESQWKYEAFLPVDEEAEIVTLGEGGTDLFEAPNLSAELGVETLVKDDGRNPTGCLKDRATSVAVTKAVHADQDVLTCASTGNAAASLAGYAARAGLEARIFVPEDAPAGKLAQPLVYGADVLAVEGSYDEAYDLSVAVTEAYGWYNRNAAINPFQVEGKRTVGHELAEQLHVRGEMADWVAFSMGDGCTIAGAWKGLKEFADLGYVEDTPKMLGVQADGAAAIHDAFHDLPEGEPVAETLADSIAVGRPRNTVKAVRALKESEGTAVRVSDQEILEAEVLLGSTEGIYTEPAGGTALAGVKAAIADGPIEPDETVVVVSTGFGLKDTESAKRATGGVTRIEPSIEAVNALYRE
ncbi:threonine synthase [Halodesulfurarchaeum formicicum]|uniref:Threonine synthase n=1 Tax=Halodesulfurarchaeum formicicum TaxID=1873524 RepID=A0A1D8S4F4_9EURY|nr:threonine synthase [Halodesulfurarchaeum formicicum]AOW80240.1 threonine synthase [Halodesulfurarchaeum formicicum]